MTPGERIAQIVRQCLADGSEIEIDGLGLFRSDEGGRFEFVPEGRPRIFLAYVEEDLPQVARLYDSFEAAGFQPWLDKKKLLPGQNWPRAIERAIEISDFFVPCFSRRAVGKRGSFHSELRYAIDCATRLPLDDIYLVPVRLEECAVPVRIAREWQYADLFPEWDRSVRKIVLMMEREMRKRNKAA
ncbi:MAG: TIR domain-containing protein [Bryobacteraceae bacterium]